MKKTLLSCARNWCRSIILRLATVFMLLVLSSAGGVRDAPADDGATSGRAITVHIPALTIDHRAAQDAYRIAIGDLLGNVVLFQDGLLERPVPVILAGLDYGTPWTRDAAINAWNGASLLMPAVSRNT
ncbi:MAG: hypothetical protein MUF48_17910, partial [Pirellulaceae bacterium]|nr:hypothetical protein [Pirellulaceae bacterium]